MAEENKNNATPQHNKMEPVVEDRYNRPYPVRTLDPPISLVDRAREIEEAEASVRTHVHGKLDVIAKQMRALKAEAREIVERAKEDLELHAIKCNFEKQIGQTMHLYERRDGSRYFSLLSPGEWGALCPHEFLGSYRLAADRSFERLDSVS